MTIRQRFIAVATVCILSLLIMMALFYNTLNQLESLNRIKEQLSNSKGNLLTLKEQEQAFIHSNDLDAANDLIEQSLAQIELLKKIRQQLAAKEIAVQSLSEAIEATKSHHAAFVALRMTKIDLGLTPSTGMYGLLRQSVHTVEKELQDIHNNALTAAMLMLRRHEKDFMLRGKDKYAEKFSLAINNFHGLLLLEQEGLKETQLDTIRKYLDIYADTFSRFVQASKKVGRYDSEGAIGQLNRQANLTLKLLSQVLSDSSDTVNLLIQKNRNQSLLITSVCILILSLCILWLYKTVLGRIRLLQQHMIKIADGGSHLDARLKDSSADELGMLAKAFNTFMSKISDSFQHTLHTANQLENSSTELNNLAEQTHRVTSDQDNQLKELNQSLSDTAGYSQEVVVLVNSTQMMTDSVNTQSELAAQLSEQNRIASQQLIADVESAVNEIEALQQDSQKISDVMSSIAEIAAQTNLLALNAAIEAARAGEQGRGFAVVADEVRNLSLKTQSSAEEIYHQIGSLQTRIQHAANTIRDTKAVTSERLAQSSKLHQVFTEIEQQITALNQKNQAILSISQQQQQAMLTAEDKLVLAQWAMRTNLSATESNQKTSQQLTDLARLLQQKMTHFGSVNY